MTVLPTVDFPDEHVMRITPPNAGMAVTIEPDPLGTVNKIIRIVRHNSDGTTTPIKAALAPVSAGTMVRFGRGILEGRNEPRRGIWEFPQWLVAGVPCWFAEVDGRRVLQVPDHETWPAFPTPKSPWHRRARHTLSCRLRTAADAAAGRLGYHRDGQCEGDEW